jgi:hypothetical protein
MAAVVISIDSGSTAIGAVIARSEPMNRKVATVTMMAASMMV